jgi:hypothetical protein
MQEGYSSDLAKREYKSDLSPATGEIPCSYVTRVDVHAHMKLTPSSLFGRLTTISAAHLKPGAIDQNMNWPLVSKLMNRHLAKVSCALRKSYFNCSHPFACACQLDIASSEMQIVNAPD